LETYFENKVSDVFIKVPYQESDAKIYNKLFSKATNDYVCILNLHIYLQKHWLTDLIYHHENIENSGVVGICSEFYEYSCVPLVSFEKESFINVFIPESNVLQNNGVSLFLRQHLYYVGGFDENIDLYRTELTHYQLRSLAMGFHNYYIPTQSAIIITENQNTDYEKLLVGYKNAYDSYKEMKKTKRYYIPLTA
jgi:hypothetical protein